MWPIEVLPEPVDCLRCSDRFSILDDSKIEQKSVDHSKELESMKSNRSSIEHFQHFRIVKTPKNSTISKRKTLKNVDELDFFFSNSKRS